MTGQDFAECAQAVASDAILANGTAFCYREIDAGRSRGPDFTALINPIRALPRPGDLELSRNFK
jgi:hypothetical protein